MSENLWPTDFGELALKTPVAILREQAFGLGQRTANIVVGMVETSAVGAGEFLHEFDLYSSPLSYKIQLLNVVHGIDLYPVKIHVWGDGSGPINATNPEEFSLRLKEVFAREKTKKTIASLIAQSKE